MLNLYTNKLNLDYEKIIHNAVCTFGYDKY